MLDNTTIIVDGIFPSVDLGEPANINIRGEYISRVYYLPRHQKKRSDEAPLKITVGKLGFSIRGSLRKWWFGTKQISKDFDYYSFTQCIIKIAKKLGIEQSEFWKSRITYRELGGNIVLPRKLDFIISAMAAYPRFRRFPYTSFTTSFKTKNEKLIAYDKMREAIKSFISKKNQAKILQRFFTLRFERKIRKTSGNKLNGLINSLEQIRDNWDFLVDEWAKCFQKIKFVTLDDPRLTLNKSHITRTDIKNLGIAMLVKDHPDFLKRIVGYCPPKKRSTEMRHFLELSQKYQSRETLEAILFVESKVLKKASQMKISIPM